MKKRFTILMMLIGLISYSQSDITNVLNEECTFSNCSVFMLGCCNDEFLDEEHPVCVYDSFQEYYVTEDIYFDRNKFVLRNSHIEFRNGANLYLQGADLVFTCDASMTFPNGGGIIQYNLSLKEFAMTLTIGEEYEIISLLGQVVRKGKFQGIEDVYSNHFGFISFPKKNYIRKLILKK